jgi:O-antigen/teichoic acid export membrane protein
VADDDGASLALSGALRVRLWICGAILLISAVLALVINRFPIPHELAGQAVVVVLLLGATLAFSLAGGVFGGVLLALNRFDVLAAITIGQTAVSAMGTVALLRSGLGIVPLATFQLFIGIVAAGAQMFAAFREYPGLRLVRHGTDSGVLGKLWNYSLYNFILSISSQVIYYTDNIVVGAFLGARAVTLYAIGGRLIEYHRQLANALAQTMMPLASAYDASGQRDGLRRLLVQGTRLTLSVIWPIQIALLLRGATFIRLWMGDAYAGPSGTILQILLISNFLITTNHVSAYVVFGMGKHKRWAIWQSCEAVANAALSIFLVRRIGLYGVAWGTTIPSLVVQGILWPRYICALLETNVLRYLAQTWVRTAVAMAPFAIGCAYVERYWPAENLATFFLQIAVTLPLVILGLAAVYGSQILRQLRDPQSLAYRLMPGWLGRGAKALMPWLGSQAS